MDKMKKAKKIYNSFETPFELNETVDRAIHIGTEKRMRKHRFYWIKAASYSFATCCVLLIITLNSSVVFAQNIYKIPVIGEVARVFTFREYKNSNETRSIRVKVPSIKDTGNTELEKRINNEIQEKMDAYILNAEKRADQERKLFFETGGKLKEYIPVFITIDYEVKYTSKNILSFVITTSEARGTLFSKQLFYNIDLKTGNNITLQDEFGKDYKKYIDAQIKEQIRKRLKQNPNAFNFISADEYPGIEENQNFYINRAGNVVIVFEKYSIAPGSMGNLEFEICPQVRN